MLNDFKKQLHSLFLFNANYKFITKLFYLQINSIANIIFSKLQMYNILLPLNTDL